MSVDGKNDVMNAEAFANYLTPIWTSHIPLSLSEGADHIATAYHISNVGQTTTPFGAPLINANKDILKLFLELGMMVNLYGGKAQSTVGKVAGYMKILAGNPQHPQFVVYKAASDLALAELQASLPPQLTFIGTSLKALSEVIFADIKKGGSNPSGIFKKIKKFEGIMKSVDLKSIAYLLMATGFCLYWLTSTISPVPPMPPCIAPTVGTTVIFPGTPIPLNSDLASSFTISKRTDEAVRKLSNSCMFHQFTIMGLYTGIIPFFPSPIPGPPIPWFTLLNIPFPNIPISKLLDKDGDGKKDDDVGGSGGQGGSGTSGNSGGQTGGTNQTPSGPIRGTSGTSSGQLGTASGQTSGGIGSTSAGSSSTNPQTSNQTQGGGGSSASSSPSGTTSSSSQYSNAPLAVTDALVSDVKSVLDVDNPFGLVIDFNRTNTAYLQLVIELHENVVVLNDGDEAFKFAVVVKLDNLAQDKGFLGSQLSLPTAIGERILYSYTDTVKSKNSIYSDVIVSPKLRAIELMRDPFRRGLSSVVTDSLRKYLDRWYGGKFPPQFQNVNAFITTTTVNDTVSRGNVIFTPLQKFNLLQ